MNNKDRRIRLFLELFFLLAALYMLLFRGWEYYASVAPHSLFDFYGGTIPVFTVVASLFTGLCCFIASWALWARASWGAAWALFTMGLLLYSNIISLGPAINNHPVQTIPMVLIILVVLQSFPFLIRNTLRYP